MTSSHNAATHARRGIEACQYAGVIGAASSQCDFLLCHRCSTGVKLPSAVEYPAAALGRDPIRRVLRSCFPISSPRNSSCGRGDGCTGSTIAVRSRTCRVATSSALPITRFGRSCRTAPCAQPDPADASRTRLPMSSTTPKRTRLSFTSLLSSLFPEPRSGRYVRCGRRATRVRSAPRSAGLGRSHE
jgi:hypothetical protein